MSRPLNGYALTNHFRKLRAQWDFTHLEAHLFLELMALCTDAKWPAEFSAKNNTLTAALGCSEPGLIKARKRLAEAGLLIYTEGQNRRPTAYRFCPLKDLNEFSDSAAEHLTEGLTEFSDSVTNERKHLTEHLTEGLTEFSPYKEQIETKKEESITASAATPPLSFSAEKLESPKPTARSQKAAARAEEIAALTLTHPGPKFAQLWAAFLTSPKQAKKPITALKLMLDKMGGYAECFACLMLEDAIQGDWSGVVFDSTAEKYAKWQAAEVERARRQPVRTTSPTSADPALNHAFIAEQQASEQAKIDEQNAEWHRTHNTDALWGYSQTAEEGLAQAKQGPDYQRYLAEQAAANQPAPAATAQEPATTPPTTAPESAQPAA